MAKKSEPKTKRRGRPQFLSGATTTSISIEKKLLDRVTKTAYALRQSVSQWVSDAAEQKLVRDAK